MSQPTASLLSVYDGWDGYHQSIVAAVSPLTPQQLTWRPAENLRSVGELALHIALGRIEWFLRMDAPGSRELEPRIPEWEEDSHGNRYVKDSAFPISDQASELVNWLDASWAMIEQTLQSWTVDDLQKTYQHTWRGDVYAIPYQWTIWRILTHDIHHGGELVLMLGMQGIENFELGDLGGHLTQPPLADNG